MYTGALILRVLTSNSNRDSGSTYVVEDMFYGLHGRELYRWGGLEEMTVKSIMLTTFLR